MKNVLKLTKPSVGKYVEKWEFSLVIGRSRNWYKHLEGHLVLLNVLMFLSFDLVVHFYKFILQKYLLKFIMIHVQGYTFIVSLKHFFDGTKHIKKKFTL